MVKFVLNLIFFWQFGYCGICFSIESLCIHRKSKTLPSVQKLYSTDEISENEIRKHEFPSMTPLNFRCFFVFVFVGFFWWRGVRYFLKYPVRSAYIRKALTDEDLSMGYAPGVVCSPSCLP